MSVNGVNRVIRQWLGGCLLTIYHQRRPMEQSSMKFKSNYKDYFGKIPLKLSSTKGHRFAQNGPKYKVTRYRWLMHGTQYLGDHGKASYKARKLHAKYRINISLVPGSNYHQLEHTHTRIRIRPPPPHPPAWKILQSNLAYQTNTVVTGWYVRICES